MRAGVNCVVIHSSDKNARMLYLEPLFALSLIYDNLLTTTTHSLVMLNDRSEVPQLFHCLKMLTPYKPIK